MWVETRHLCSISLRHTPDVLSPHVETSRSQSRMQNSEQLIVRCSGRRDAESVGKWDYSPQVGHSMQSNSSFLYGTRGRDQRTVSIPLMPFALATHRLYLEIEYHDGTRSLRNVYLCCASSAPKYNHLYRLGITLFSSGKTR